MAKFWNKLGLTFTGLLVIAAGCKKPQDNTLIYSSQSDEAKFKKEVQKSAWDDMTSITYVQSANDFQNETIAGMSRHAGVLHDCSKIDHSVKFKGDIACLRLTQGALDTLTRLGYTVKGEISPKDTTIFYDAVLAGLVPNLTPADFAKLHADSHIGHIIIEPRNFENQHGGHMDQHARRIEDIHNANPKVKAGQDEISRAQIFWDTYLRMRDTLGYKFAVDVVVIARP